GGDPAEPRIAPPAGYAVLNGCRAQHAGPAELDQHRSLGVVQPAAGDLDLAQLIDRGPAVCSRHRRPRLRVSLGVSLRTANDPTGGWVGSVLVESPLAPEVLETAELPT